MSGQLREADEALAARLETMGIPRNSYAVAPMDGVRKVIARRMTESARDIPHFPIDMDIEAGGLLALRVERKRAGGEGPLPSLNDYLIKAAALALMECPDANVSYMPEGRILHRSADIAVAVAIEGGLVTPIVRGAEAKDVTTIAAEMADLAARARNRRLLPDEYTGGTFSVSNLGMFGVKSFGSILNPPQACILSVGAVEPRGVGRNGRLELAQVMSVTLTCDHRVVDGATGARWLKCFKAIVEKPGGLR